MAIEREAPLLALEGVVAGYGAMTILNGTSFAVRAGTITTIIGPNGAGKSTVFKTIFGLLRPRAGAVRFAGEAITGVLPRELLRRGLSYVPQGRNLFPELSVRHNLELGMTAAPPRTDRAARLADAMARFPTLARKASHQASTLSGGEQKLLEIARALLLAPRLMLIDEPSIGLSPIMAAEIFAMLRALRAGGTTIVMVEQNAKSALEISDDALVLELGRTRLAGPAAAILADPRVGALFLGGAMTRAS